MLRMVERKKISIKALQETIRTLVRLPRIALTVQPCAYASSSSPKLKY